MGAPQYEFRFSAGPSDAGLPVIATPVGDITGIVLEEKTGSFVQQVGAQYLIERLHLLAGNVDLRRQMGEAVGEHAV